MLFLFYLTLVISIITFIIFIICLLLVISVIKISKKIKECLNNGIDAVKDTLNKLPTLIKLFFRKKLNKMLTLDNAHILIFFRPMILKTSIVGIIALIISLIMFSLSSSLYNYCNAMNTVTNLIPSFFKNEEEEEEEEKEEWTWDLVTDPSETEEGTEKRYKKGEATGKYAIKLDDGMYYWYHQSGGGLDHNCDNCGDWSTSKWGSVDTHAFGSDGCAVYSLAIITSNLVGAPITPMKLFEDFKCDIGIEKGLVRVDTTKSLVFNNRSIIYNPAIDTIKNKYKLETSSLTVSKSDIEDRIQFVDDILAKGGYVWGYWVDSKCKWCGNGSQHFMGIRKKEGDNYYCFTSCSGKCSNLNGKQGAIETMNYPLDKTECLNALVSDSYLYGLWNPYIETNYIGGGTEWYASAYNISKYTDSFEITGGVKIYNGLPWDGTHAYVFDTDAATKSVYGYLESTGGGTLNKSLNYSLTANGRISSGISMWDGTNSKGKTTLDYLRGENWVHNVGAYTKEIEGINCVGVAVPPAVIEDSYCNDFSKDMWKNQSTPNSNKYEYSNKKMCIILKDKTTNSIYYLPCTTADAKGHTFPGGIMQTNISISGYSDGIFKVNVAKTSGDAGGEKQDWAESELLYKMNNEVTAGSNPVDYFYGACETYGWSSALYDNITSKYRVVGYVVW